MRFEVKTELSKEDFRSYYRLNNKVHARLAFLFGKGGTILAVIMAVVLTILMAAFRLWKTDALLPYVLYLVFLIAWPLVAPATMRFSKSWTIWTGSLPVLLSKSCITAALHIICISTKHMPLCFPSAALRRVTPPPSAALSPEKRGLK